MMPSPDVASMMQQGMMQKAQGQKANIQYAPNVANNALAQQMGMQGQNGQQPGGDAGFQHQQAPREMGTIQEEALMAVQDIGKGLLEVINILGLGRAPKDPQEQAKLQQFHQRWQQLSQEEQQVAQQRLQANQQRKEVFEQEAQAKKQQEEEMKKKQQLEIPQGKVSGQAALDKMNKDRKGMGGASG